MSARNPGLCRRVAAAVQRMGLEPPDRVVVAQLVERAARFDDLPGWLQTMVNQAERHDQYDSTSLYPISSRHSSRASYE